MTLVIGRGVTGRVVERWARGRGDVVVVVDDDETRPAGVLDTPAALALLEDIDLVVPSPGVAPSHPVVVEARRRGITVVAEIDLATDAMTSRLIAVTGTNGKSTVTTLIAEMLRASGVDAATAGNIGDPLLSVVEKAHEVVVAEVSSFQLAGAERFHPDVAVILNVAEDHLDWHGDFEEYIAAKARIVAQQTSADTVVYNADDPVVAHMVEDVAPRAVGFSTTDDPTDALAGARLPRHLEVSNAIAAAAAARVVGAREAGIATAIENFGGLPHRVELVGEAGGVRWIDDSKATNPHAANHAIARFESVVLLAGGRNKGLDLSVMRLHGSRLRVVIAFGESSTELVSAFAESETEVRVVADLGEAVATAAEIAVAGDTVLLSPGCTSLDAYRNYGERGDHFRAEVQALLGADQGAS